MNNKGVWSFGSRHGLLACVYNGVSLTINALVAGNGSYIVRLSVRDLHGPTMTNSKIFELFRTVTVLTEGLFLHALMFQLCCHNLFSSIGYFITIVLSRLGILQYSVKSSQVRIQSRTFRKKHNEKK